MITGDTYVGVTGCNGGLRVRMYHHKCRAKKGTHNHLPLYVNINEYGWDNFHSQILCDGDEEEYMVWLMRPTLNQCWNGRECPENVKNSIRESNSKRVLCVETGEVYPSATAAGIAIGKPKGYSAISNNLRGKSETAYGYHWQFV